MTRRSVRRASACEVVVENGSCRGKVLGVAEPDLGKHLVERNLSAKRGKVLVPDVRLYAGFFEQGPQQVRFYEVGCGIELFHIVLFNPLCARRWRAMVAREGACPGVGSSVQAPRILRR